MSDKFNTFKNIFFKLLGPVIFGIIISSEPPEDLSESGFHLLGVTIWMAIWWIFEVVPIAVTALIPIITFPLFGILPIGDTTSQYGHKLIFLYIGGFILARHRTMESSQKNSALYYKNHRHKSQLSHFGIYDRYRFFINVDI